MLSVPPGAAPSSGFGASQSAAGNAFGQPAAQSQGAAAPVFGQMATQQSAPAFGTPSMGFGFGQSQAAAATGGGFGFGQRAATSTPSTGFGFGQTQAAGASPSLQTLGQTHSSLHPVCFSCSCTASARQPICSHPSVIHNKQVKILNYQSLKLCKY